MTSPAPRLAAALADRYRIERELGQGGMATVYLAQDLKHDRQVAIKVLRPELAAVIGAERFLTEIKTTAHLQHPHILPLFDSGAADSFLFYVMPFVEGESLRDRLNREKQLPIPDAVRIATEVAGALDYAHRHGVIHRDIKPENILLHDGRALVADFGIALAASSAGGRMTETGMSLGTPHYMSPEQAMGDRELTPRSDVYALGAMTYEMLLGEPPFTGPTAQSIVAKVMTEKPVALIARRERIPPQVEDAVLTALEKLPADRWGSAKEFAEALDGKLVGRYVGKSVKGAPTDVPTYRPTVLLIGALALAAASLTTALIVLAKRGGNGVDLSHVSIVQKTYTPETIFSARWAADGKTLVYSATEVETSNAGAIAPLPRLYIVRGDYPEPQPFGPDTAHLLAVSSTGEVALLTHPRLLGQRVFTGTLSRMPLGGGAPREIVDSIQEADFSPDGSQLAVTRSIGDRDQLEYPIGKALYQSRRGGYLSDLRVSPDGDRVAFFDHPLRYDDRGWVVVVDTKGDSASVKGEFGGLEGLAWEPGGKSLLFTGAVNGPYQLRRARIGGDAPVVLPMAGRLTLHDATPAGDWLVTRDDTPQRILVRAPGGAGIRDVSWLDGSLLPAISPDGRLLAFSDQGTLSSALYGVMLRPTSGGPAVRLGDGDARAISPDNRWVLGRVPTAPPEWRLYPTRAGAPRNLSWSGLEAATYVDFFPDGSALLVCGREPGKPSRCYRSTLEGGSLEPITPDSVGFGMVRPDGKAIGLRRGREWWVYPVGEGAGRMVPGLEGVGVLRWSPDGSALWVRGLVDGKLSIDRVDVATGRRATLVTIETPPGLAVYWVSRIVVADDPEVYAYYGAGYLSLLYAVRGVR